MEEMEDPTDGAESMFMDELLCPPDVKLVVNRKSPKSSNCSKPHKCPNCFESFNVLANLNLHISIHAEPPFVCLRCGKSFKRLASFQGHIKTHFQSEYISCKHCPEIFHYFSAHDDHLRTEHKKVTHKKLVKKKSSLTRFGRLHSCTACNKQFGRISTLRRHER